MTPSAWSSPVLDVYQADLQDSDVATAQTIQTMCDHIHQAAKDPFVQRAALAAEHNWRMGGPGGAGCWWWVKHAVKVLPHSQFKALLAAYPEKRQLLVSPSVVLRAANPAGDCSTFSMLLAAMLESLGVRWELVTVAVDPDDPSLYSHVFPRAVLSDGRRITLDGSHGKYPGWEVPRAHQLRRQVWDSNGEPIDDDAPAVSQLHAYTRRPGLGQDDITDYGGDASAFASAGDTSGVTTLSLPGLGPLPDLTTTTVTTSSGAVPGVVAPSQSSANWAAFATALAKSGMTLAEINAIQPGTVVGANGQILRQATGLPVPVGTGLTAALGTSSTTMWLILALVVGGVVLFSSKR